jgi:hypothetical protein
MARTRISRAMLTVNHRSWLDCRLRLVVRYVNDKSTQETHCHICASLDICSHFQGYHVPAVRHRDAFYQKLEDDRAAALGQK